MDQVLARHCAQQATLRTALTDVSLTVKEVEPSCKPDHVSPSVQHVHMQSECGLRVLGLRRQVSEEGVKWTRSRANVGSRYCCCLNAVLVDSWRLIGRHWIPAICRLYPRRPFSSAKYSDTHVDAIPSKSSLSFALDDVLLEEMVPREISCPDQQLCTPRHA